MGLSESHGRSDVRGRERTSGWCWEELLNSKASKEKARMWPFCDLSNLDKEQWNGSNEPNTFLCFL